jgi:hypothetical protein
MSAAPTWRPQQSRSLLTSLTEQQHICSYAARLQTVDRHCIGSSCSADAATQVEDTHACMPDMTMMTPAGALRSLSGRCLS